MLKLRNVTGMLLNRGPRFFISDKFMKQRDQASQRVYISRQQKEAMKRLLGKLSEQKSQDLSKQGEFERRLNDILKRYKIQNDNFVEEIVKIHKQYY